MPISQATVTPAKASQILRLLDDLRRRRLPSPISSPKIIEDTHCLSWRPGGMDLFDMGSMDCGRSLPERRSSICDCVQPMHTCVLWAAEGVVR